MHPLEQFEILFERLRDDSQRSEELVRQADPSVQDFLKKNHSSFRLINQHVGFVQDRAGQILPTAAAGSESASLITASHHSPQPSSNCSTSSRMLRQQPFVRVHLLSNKKRISEMTARLNGDRQRRIEGGLGNYPSEQEGALGDISTLP